MDEQHLLLRLDLSGEEGAMMVPLYQAIWVLHKVSIPGAELMKNRVTLSSFTFSISCSHFSLSLLSERWRGALGEVTRIGW